MTALAMVILSHMRSRISSPESGSCMTRTTALMSLFTVRGTSSSSVGHSSLSHGQATHGSTMSGQGIRKGVDSGWAGAKPGPSSQPWNTSLQVLGQTWARPPRPTD